MPASIAVTKSNIGNPELHSQRDEKKPKPPNKRVRQHKLFNWTSIQFQEAVTLTIVVKTKIYIEPLAATFVKIHFTKSHEDAHTQKRNQI